jgi:hypothetical protein
MTYIKKNSDGSSNSFNFKAPAGAVNQENEVLFPFTEKQEPAYAAMIAATVKQMDTFIQPAQLTGNATLNLTIDSQVTPGAKVHLKLAADNTGRTVALGTGFDAAAADVVVPATKVVFLTFIYDGAAFVPVVDINYVNSLIAALDARVTALEGA